MMKRGLGILICLGLILIISLGVVSASLFGGIVKKIRGKAISGEDISSVLSS